VKANRSGGVLRRSSARGEEIHLVQAYLKRRQKLSREVVFAALIALMILTAWLSIAWWAFS
jgi:hypothetical protein